MSKLPSNNNSNNNVSSLDFHSLASSSYNQTYMKRRTFKFLARRHQQGQVMDAICRHMGSKDEIMMEQVSSLYLDTTELSFYNRLLVGNAKGNNRTDREMATLFRIRKYQEQPHLVWIELKTYRWNSTDADPNHPESIKERVALSDRDIGSFLSTTWEHTDAKKALQKISTNGGNSNNLDEEGNISLLLGMQQMIQSLQLRPCVETKYSRMAFTSKSIRITLDWDIMVGPADQRLSSTITSGEAVSRGSDNKNKKFQKQSFLQLPFSILEIKLPSSLSTLTSPSAAAAANGGVIPTFLQTLLRNGTLQECPKFSKFMTAVAIFNKDNISSKLLPYWMDSITSETGSEETISALNQTFSYNLPCREEPNFNSRL